MRDICLSPAQQYFLQIILNKGVLDQINFKVLFCNVLKKFQIEYEETQIKPMYVKFLREINEAIKHFNMEIKAGNCEITGLSYYCIIRLCDSSSIGDLSQLYSAAELKIFRKVLELIVESENGSVDYNLILNEILSMFDELSEEAQGSQSQIEKCPTNRDIRIILEKFMQDNWLIEIINAPNMITLHGRALIELCQYIKQIFPPEDLSYCYLCKFIVLNNFSCSGCSMKLHRYCAKRFFKGGKDCPSCKQSFSKDQIDGLLESLSSAKNAYACSQFSSQS
ncbi:non-structural maintenance of chromosomes element 1 -like protein [Brachionus plicatilis]|uniref:Non-structural maintenance of chromosomes element 1 homolog n=1 Tax=Brachionus plicatilis TaxID=10195 RepID=A0A3M7RTP4_BRAPC|nr:non-structural maintenance of chromosomes element 1 -like protein [Brachionus plicatilis]